MEKNFGDFSYTAEHQAKSYDELIAYCREVTKSKTAELIDISLPLLGTEEGKVLFEEQVYALLLQMLSYVYVNTWYNRKEKQKKGIAAAKAEGKHLGRKRQFNTNDYLDIFRRLQDGDITKTEAIAEIGSGETTFFRIQRELRQQGLI